MAASAWTSTIGELAVETKASIACVSASMPVQAVRYESIVSVHSGSTKATSGTTVLLMIAIL